MGVQEVSLIKNLLEYYEKRFLKLNYFLNKKLPKNCLLELSFYKDEHLIFPVNYSDEFGKSLLWGLKTIHSNPRQNMEEYVIELVGFSTVKVVKEIVDCSQKVVKREKGDEYNLTNDVSTIIINAVNAAKSKVENSLEEGKFNTDNINKNISGKIASAINDIIEGIIVDQTVAAVVAANNNNQREVKIDKVITGLKSEIRCPVFIAKAIIEDVVIKEVIAQVKKCVSVNSGSSTNVNQVVANVAETVVTAINEDAKKIANEIANQVDKSIENLTTDALINVPRNEGSLFFLLKNEIKTLYESASGNLEFTQLLVAFLIITSEFFFLIDLLNLDKTTPNIGLVLFLTRIINFFHLKLIALFQIAPELSRKWISEVNTGGDFTSEMFDRLIADCNNTLTQLKDENPDISEIELPYLLMFEQTFCLFNAKHFFRLIDSCKQFSKHEIIIKSIAFMNVDFYRDHFVHSLNVASLMLKLAPFFNIKDASDKNKLILGGLLHDLTYPIEKASYVVDGYLDKLKKSSHLAVQFQKYKSELSKCNILEEDLLESKFYLYIKKIMDNSGSDSNLFNEIHKELFFSKNCDHGYLSAFTLYTLAVIKRIGLARVMAQFDELLTNSALSEQSINVETLQENILSSLGGIIVGILTHNLDVKKIPAMNLKTIINHTSTHLKSRYLLRLADSIQEWARETSKKTNANLVSLNFCNNRSVTFEIEYTGIEARVMDSTMFAIKKIKEEELKFLENGVSISISNNNQLEITLSKE